MPQTGDSKNKKKNPKPKPGDVFLVEVQTEDDNVWYYCKVIKTNIQNDDGLYKGSNLVFVYKKWTREVTQSVEELLPSDLLAPPIMIWNEGWTSGHFQVIYNVSVSDEELAVDYGFQHFTSKKFLDEHGKPLDHVPWYKGLYGIKNHFVLDQYIQKYL